jgi:hypothetical protein
MIGIQHKPTQTDTMIHNTSNDCTEHKHAAHKYMIHRINTSPNTQEAKMEEYNRIKLMARKNGYQFSKVKLHMDKSQSVKTERDNHPIK